MQLQERVIGCFKALANGDAVGKQTEMLSRTDVLRWYPAGVTGFHGQPGEVIPRYAGERYQWRIGETTDDTEQTLAVTRSILKEGCVCHGMIGQQLMQCKKSLHPGVALWRFVQLGDPARIARDGDGCGAAMRTAPVGVLYSSHRIDQLIGGAYECAIPTHGGQMAVCAAAAVAAAVSAALDGLPAVEVLSIALKASEAAERLCPSEETPKMADAIRDVYVDLAGRKHLIVDELVERYFPNKPRNIVPLALALALVTQSAQETTLLATNIGGDSDSVASIGSAVAGAIRPETVNDEWFDVVRRINNEDLIGPARLLAALRS